MDGSAHERQHDSVDEQPEPEHHGAGPNLVGAGGASTQDHHHEQGDERCRQQKGDLAAELTAE